MVATSRLVPLHDSGDPLAVATLANAMSARGWEGPPLVGWCDTAEPDGYDERTIWLANGSDYLTAAEYVCLEEIPVIVVELPYEKLVSSGAARDGHIGLTNVSAFRKLIQSRWPDAAAPILEEGTEG